MTAFRYEAVDANGRLARGVVDADSARAARDVVRGKGLTPTAVDAAPAMASGIAVNAPQLAMATRQLATLAQSGMTLDAALAAAAEQAEAPRVAKLLDAVRGDVSAGQPIHAALARHPRAFPPLYRGLAAAGAESGRLADVLLRLADYLEARQALRQRFIAAMVYPALVTLIALLVIGVLLVYVVPQIVSVYQQSHQTLPFLTRALIATSDFFRATGWYWLALVATLVIAATLAWRRDAFRRRAQSAMLRMPLAGRLARSLDSARFASTLAILTGSGTPLLRALDAAADVVRMLPIEDAARAAAARVREGVPLARALKAQGVFPPVLVHLIASGEASGRLTPMLERAALELEGEAERRLTWIAALVQPALIVLMGALVLILVLAVMLPIVTMNQLIR
ncbi:MAG TPA: type II secretion system inner membrane protein GspF [Casimicrobiaceae bacterium]|jgi:general secretion pathway protein F|nr:type II secretion system inner membrane protein GspF [Casimicrobiaceae bacterium]